MAETASIPEDHRIHGADRARIRTELVELFDDGLLAGIGDVQSREAKTFGGGQDFGQGRYPDAKHIEIYELVHVAHALRIAFLLVQAGRERGLNARSYQSDED